MNDIYINYSNLEESVKKLERARNEISDYIEEIKSTITTPISRLPGSDALGYASTASSLAYKKINDLNNKSDSLRRFGGSLKSFISTAKAKDNYVSQRIEEISDLVIKRRTIMQRAGDWLYDTFCVDLANKSEVIRGFVDCTKWIGDNINHTFGEIKDWFKYGNGKYVLNVVLSVAASVAAVAAIVVAIAAIPATGGTSVMLIGFLKVGVATASGVITIVNSTAKAEGNTKALILKDKPGAARYYGNISTIHDEWKKTDKGDEKTNKFYETMGKTIDTTENVLDVMDMGLNIAELGIVRDYRFKDPNKQIKGYNFTKDNIKKNLKQSMGIWTSKGKNGEINIKKAFNIKDSFLATSYKKKFMIDDKLIIPDNMYKVFHVNKIFKNVYSFNESISIYKDKLKHAEPSVKDALETTKAVTNLLSYTKFTKVFKTYGSNGLDIIYNTFF